MYEECRQCQEEERISNSGKWLNEVDERVFTFKRKIYSCLKEINKVYMR